jgi:Na+/phosphate symporter
VKFILTKETQDFIAKYLGDMSKAILTVGFASYFFEKLPWPLRIGFILAAFALFIISVTMIEKKGGSV